MLLNDSWRLQSHLNLSRVSHILPNDPEHVLMTSFVGPRPALFKVNVYDGSSETVIKGGRRTEGFLSDNNGNPLYRWDVVFRGKAIFIYKLEDDGKWEHVETIEFDEEDEFGLVGLAKDGGLLYRKRNEETGYYEIIKRHKSEGRTEVLVSLPDRDVLSLIIDSQSDQVIGYRVEGDVIRNRYFDEELQAEYDNLKDRLMGYGFHFYSMSDKRRRSVIKSYGMDFPGSYFIYDHEKDELAFHANIYGGLRLVDLAVPATTTYLTRDKAQVRMYILLPPGYRQGQSYPMVVLVHGGPQARSYALYNNFAQFIATRGYIVVQPNFRGSTGYGLEFEKAGYKELGRLMQDDLDDAVAFMVKKGMADESRVCIAGISYGGYAALMGLIKSPALYRCAISINGVTHLRDQVKFDEKRFSNWPVLIDGVHERIGDPKVDRKYMDEHSPLLRAGEIKSPLLLIAGERDEVVPFKQSRNLAKALKRAKAEFTFLPLEDAWHNVFYYREDREKVYKAVEGFLKKNL
jgi:dipeptidyl aminopeptidase/acylaminoacyl peptidase